MKLHKRVIAELAVTPGKPPALAGRGTRDTKAEALGVSEGSSPRDLAERDLDAFKAELSKAQQLLYAADSRALLVIFQGLDAAGKDGTIKHVMSGVNPQGCDVVSFKAPSQEELSHDFLWRCAKALPGRGRIGIFNRSYYEDVLVPRVHPEILARQPQPAGAAHGKQVLAERHEDINAFELHLHRSGTRIVKFFLHVSKDEQKRRLLKRLNDPAKSWKFSVGDVAERSHFDEYQRAYEETIAATSTDHAPWYVVPADHKYLMRALVGGILLHVMDQLDLRLPERSDQQQAALEAARKALLAE